MTNVTGGSISIDDIDISKVSLKRLRSRISLVPQEPVLFTGSVRYNVDPCGFYTDEEIWTALRIAHLDGYVSNTDGALQHNIASFGANLTLSQRQLLCLARALVRRSRILILDEATTAVDQTVDDLVEEGIRKEFPESTLILVAHRLKTVLSADRMIVLDNGEVVDQDSPNALLVNTDSVFYNCKRSWSDSHLWKRTSVILEEGESDAS
ncbi:ATP-binding cassette sub-family C member 2 [Halotydeus destructor]|nr:ATP-binding cassette sub-family C member 2 [Halotydeus destructor]